MKSAEKLHTQIQAYALKLEKYADRFWYAPLIGILAILDNIIVVIPNDGILIASAMLIPKRWVLFAFSVAIGSSIGAVVLALLVEHQGGPWVMELFPGIDKSQIWIWTKEFFEKYGLIVVFVVGLSPILQQPVIIIAALASTPLYKLAAVIFLGRLIKYLLMAYLGSHSPRLLKKIWGIESELKDAGVKIE